MLATEQHLLMFFACCHVIKIKKKSVIYLLVFIDYECYSKTLFVVVKIVVVVVKHLPVYRLVYIIVHL